MAWAERGVWAAGIVLLLISFFGGVQRHSLAVGHAVAAQCSEWR